MPPVPRGILLAALNVVVVAIGVAGMTGESKFATWVVLFGIIPAVIAGGLLGWLADAIRPLPIWARRSVLLAPTLLLVTVPATQLSVPYFIRQQFSLQDFILLSCIPTAVATLLLERHTRLAVAPAVPMARSVAQQPAPPTLRQLS